VEKLFILYGYTGLAFQFKETLTIQKKRIFAYMDERAAEIKSDDSIPVYKLGEEPILDKDKKNFIVIICLQDALKHEEVAAKLYEKGYNKILFLPIGRKENSCEAQILRRLFMDLCYGEIIEWKYVPSYKREDISEKDSIIFQCEEYVIFKCPFPLLFCGAGELNRGIIRSKTTLLEINKYADKNIVCLDYYYKLFLYFMEGQGDYSSYLRIQRKEGEEREFLENRRKLIFRYEHEFIRNSNFFQDAPLKAVWNKKGYFNIIDGHHRAVYLILKGIYYLPIVVERDDYELFCNYHLKHLVQELYRERIIEKIKCPILFPLFYDMQENKEKEVFETYKVIISYWFVNNLPMESILDISDYDMFFARELKRLGCKDVGTVVWNEHCKNSMDRLNAIVHVNGIDEIEVFSSDDSYEYVWVLNALSMFSNLSKGLQWIWNISEKGFLMEVEDLNMINYINENFMIEYWTEIKSKIFKLNCNKRIILFMKPQNNAIGDI